jgi:hypothetical protein
MFSVKNTEYDAEGEPMGSPFYSVADVAALDADLTANPRVEVHLEAERAFPMSDLVRVLENHHVEVIRLANWNHRFTLADSYAFADYMISSDYLREVHVCPECIACTSRNRWVWNGWMLVLDAVRRTRDRIEFTTSGNFGGCKICSENIASYRVSAIPEIPEFARVARAIKAAGLPTDPKTGARVALMNPIVYSMDAVFASLSID